VVIFVLMETLMTGLNRALSKLQLLGTLGD